MPFFEILVYGRSVTPEEKEKLFQGCREVAQNVLGSAPSQVRIAIHQWDEQSYFDGSIRDGGDPVSSE